jgi:hypothetical protein
MLSRYSRGYFVFCTLIPSRFLYIYFVHYKILDRPVQTTYFAFQPYYPSCEHDLYVIIINVPTIMMKKSVRNLFVEYMNVE